MSYVIKIWLNNLADGDVTEIAQQIWYRHAEACDAKLGDFKVSISKDGFPMDWEPEDV